MPACREKASATVSRSGSAKGSASRPRKEKDFAPARSAASASSAAQSVHQALIGFAGAVPFEHGEFRMVQRPALAVAVDRAEAEDSSLAGRKQLLTGKFRRGVQIERRARRVRQDRLGGEGREMRLVARRDLQGCGLDLDEVAAREPVADGSCDGVALQQARAAVGVSVGSPPGRGVVMGLRAVFCHAGAAPHPYPLPVRTGRGGVGVGARAGGGGKDAVSGV